MKDLSINKNLGEGFEEYLRNLLKINDIWSVKLKEKENGAAFDIIASLNNIFIGIEAKHIKRGNRFSISRIEVNQQMSINKLRKLGTDNTWFFFYVDGNIGIFNNFIENNIYIMCANDVLNCNKKSINVVENGISFKEWIKKIK